MDSQALFKNAEDLRNQEKLNEAIEVYQQARELAFRESNLWVAYESLHMIGLLYQQQDQLEKAEEILAQSQQEMQDWVAMVLRDRARVAIESKNLVKAEKLIKQSIELFKNSEQKGHLGISQVQLAKILTEKGELETAEDLVKDSIKLIEKSDNRFFESTAYFNLGQIQKQAGKIDEAKKSIQKSVEILDSITSPQQHKGLKEQRKKYLEEQLG
jgi:tetratricopeptide (TPR) repeat protein